MGTCNIDHSHRDVWKKFESQREFLPGDLGKKIQQFLENDHPQNTLNDLFHLLKKYDLASGDERKDRNAKLSDLVE